MNIIDMHCDTIYKLINSKEDKNLRKNDLSIDIEKLKKGNSLAQFFALFIDKEECESSLETCFKMLDRFYLELKENTDNIRLARNYEELCNNKKLGKISAFLTIEEGGALKGQLYNLRNFYRLGVRLITLTWNYENEIGFPNCKEEYMEKGLTPFGIELIEEMNKLGMIIDVSHLSDAGFYDVAKYSKDPFVASHSNARAITPHKRNLTDEMIKTLSDKGGVMGINFCNYFLDTGSGYPEDTGDISRIDDMIKHIKHIKNVGGIQCIALGTDFDGISCPVEIEDISHIEKLVIALKKEGFSEKEIEMICYKNAERVIKNILR